MKLLQINTMPEKINLGDEKLTDQDAKNLAQVMRDNLKMTDLNLYNNTISDEGIRELSAVIANHTSIKCLNLGSNQLIKKGWIDFFNALAVNKSLIEVNLRYNSIDIEIIRLIMPALSSNKSMSKLILCHTQLNDEGAILLTETLLTNDTLTFLDLSNNLLSDVGAQRIAQILRFATKKVELNLNQNNLGNLGVLELLYSVKINDALKIHLNYNPCNVQCFEKYISKFELNSRLLMSSKRVRSLKTDATEFLQLLPLLDSMQRKMHYIACVILTCSREFFLPIFTLFPLAIKKIILSQIDSDHYLTEQQLEQIFIYAADKHNLTSVTRQDFLKKTQCDKIMQSLSHFSFLNSCPKHNAHITTATEEQNNKNCGITQVL